MKILIFGNPHLKEDNLAIKVCEYIKQQMPEQRLEFIEIKDTFQLLNENLENSIVIDVVQNLEKVQIINPEQLKNSSIQTAHDFDAGFFIKLTKQKPRIIGIPQQGDVREIAEGVKLILNSIIPNQLLRNE